MNTITKALAALILAIMMMSCNLDGNLGMGVSGNGDVITKERPLKDTFNSVKISRGLNLYLSQNDTERLTIEADENLHHLITTTVENNTLIISTTENIGIATSKNIMLNFKNLSSIKATSGSDVFSTNTIQAEDIELNTTSGSDMKLSITALSISCHATSGSDIELEGEADKFIASATTGSTIKAKNLRSLNAQVNASSGADIVVNTSQKLTAKASSGGDVRYVGNPEYIEKSDGTSGSIKKD